MKDKEIDAVKFLLNPDVLKRKKPWDISIHFLLNEFYKFLKSKPLLDYKLSGLALLTSSILYKLKVEHLFYEEKRRVIVKKEVDISAPISPLYMPFRVDIHASDIDELLEAFEALLLEMEREERKVRPSVIRSYEEFPVFNQESFLKMLRPIEECILDILDREAEVSFQRLVKDKDVLEVVRYFLVLLYLAQRGRVVLVQRGEDDILIVGVER